MTENSLKPVIAVVDKRELRQAGLISLLKSWDDLSNYRLVSLPSAKGLYHIDNATNFRLVIFNLGAEALLEEGPQQGIKLARALTSGPGIVVISDREESDEVLEALHLGVQGFIPTGLDVSLTRLALIFISNGGSYFPTTALRALAGSHEPGRNEIRCGEVKSKLVSMRDEDVDPEDTREQEDDSSNKFTVREAAVLEQLQLGLANKLIARQLGMTEATVKVHVRHIMRKLGAANRTQAALSSRPPPTADFAQVNTS